MLKAARGKAEPTGIGGALCNDKWVISCMFSKSFVERDSNEADVFAILEALMIFSSLSSRHMIVERDSYNVIS